MATTTNYGWTTPDDTALVKDGASAIRSLGTSVDTTTKNLNPSTTLGDIEYRSSTANTNTRLGIGSNGNVLTVSGGVPAWAAPAGGGGMTLLSTTTLSGASTNITGISGDYNNLYIVMSGVTASGNYATLLRPNNNSSSIYYQQVNDMVSGTTPSLALSTITEIGLPYSFAITSSFADNISICTIYNYASSTTRKLYQTFCANQKASGGNKFNEITNGVMESNTAITSLNFVINAGTYSTGTVLVYGVK